MCRHLQIPFDPLHGQHELQKAHPECLETADVLCQEQGGDGGLGWVPTYGVQRQSTPGQQEVIRSYRSLVHQPPKEEASEMLRNNPCPGWKQGNNIHHEPGLGGLHSVEPHLACSLPSKEVTKKGSTPTCLQQGPSLKTLY